MNTEHIPEVFYNEKDSTWNIKHKNSTWKCRCEEDARDMVRAIETYQQSQFLYKLKT